MPCAPRRGTTMPKQQQRIANTITNSAAMARNKYTHAGERVLSMLADIRARINRITKQVGPEHKNIPIISKCDTLIIEGHDAPMHQYDTNTIWCTMQRLRKRINVFATKTLTYSTGTTAPHNEHDDSSDSEDEREETNLTAENDPECPESKFRFQANRTEMEQPEGIFKCSFNSITGCLESIKNSIK